MTVSATAKAASSARERLLDAADELFYQEGVNTVGIDRVIARAGVAKASLYNTFGSKEELIRAYLARRLTRRRERLQRMLARFATPRERLLGVFAVQGELFADPAFRGCAFQRATAETPCGSGLDAVCAEWRAFLRGLFTDLAGAAGIADPARLAGQLVLLYDGATTGALMDRDPGVAVVARAAAEVLVGAASSA